MGWDSGRLNCALASIPSNRAPGGSIFQRSQSIKIVSTNSPKHPYPWLDFLILERGALLEGEAILEGIR